MSVVQLAGVDLFFRAKIEAMLTASGHEVIAKPGGPAPDLVIADVNRTRSGRCAGAVPGRAGARLRPAHRSRRRCARRDRRGTPRWSPRSVLNERLPELVSELVR